MLGVREKKTTLADIAKLAGVSKTAVSKALLGSRGKTIKVSEEAALRIKKVAEELNYFPNHAARQLATKRSGFIAYILSDSIKDGLNNSYFNRYLSGVERGCRENGYGLYVARANLMDIKNVVFPEKLKQQSVDGIIAVGQIPDEVFSEFRRYSVPVIFLNRDFDYERRFPTFCADAMDGLRKAVEYGISLNHRKFWFCRCMEKADKIIKKIIPVKTHFEKSIDGFKMKFTDFLEGFPYDEEVIGKRLLEEWKKTPDAEKPTFIFGDTRIIIAFLHKLADAGIKCPEDISAMSSADLEINSYFYPPVSSMDYDFEQMGFDAVKIMLDAIGKEINLPVEKSRNDYTARLIERKSTRRLK